MMSGRAWLLLLPLALMSSVETSAGPAASGLQAVPAGPTIVEVRIHGNHTTPDEQILEASGVRVGDAFDDRTPGEVAGRLRAAGRFRSVEVRKRFASIADPSAIALVILVEEQVGVSVDVPSPGPMQRLRAQTMLVPILRREDGYGFTYGARIGVVGPEGATTRLTVPLLWGGERRAGVEVVRSFGRGPFTSLAASAGVWQRENPFAEVADRRTELTLRAERVLRPWIRVAAAGRAADVSFGASDDRELAAGADLTIDTRRDPAFPRNAVYVAAGIERLWFDRSRDTIRNRLDLRAFRGLVGQTVLAVRAQQVWAADPLPVFDQALLGGAASLRGFPLGFRAGDRLLAGSAELRAPITSPLRVARLGVAVFADTGAAWGADERLEAARFDTGVGGGIFLTAPILSMRVDVARGIGGGTHGHFTLGVTF
jgi:outer membrane protein assembly factor BamA